MMSTSGFENHNDLLQLRKLFQHAIACDAAERRRLLERARVKTPELADRLDAMLRIDQEATCTVFPNAAQPSPVDDCKHIEGYEIIEEIGQGGMGIVYRARQLHPERIVALKMIRVGGWASKSETQRFEVEIRAIAKLVHPNIVPIYEIGEQDGEHFFTMQYIEGGRFDEYLASDQFDRHQAIDMFLQICEAVAYCHQQGVVHRDLKPANILLDRMLPKVTDFGLAKEMNFESTITNTGDVVGTPGYMAPEQAANDAECAVDARADVYSLGAILYKLLTGSVPIEFKGCDFFAAIERIHTCDITLPRSRDRTIPSDLEAICMKCLARRKEDRYETARDLADDVRRYLKREPVSAVPITEWRRLYNWARRRPGLATTIVGVSSFYVYHLFCIYMLKLFDLSLPDDRLFFQTATLTALLWLGGATFFQRQLMTGRHARWPIFGWAAMEPLLLTSLLLANNSSPTDPMNSVYLLLVTVSVLRFDPKIVTFVTIACVGSYSTIVWQAMRVSETVGIRDFVPILLSMMCIGLTQFFALRRSHIVLEHLDHRNRIAVESTVGRRS